MLEPMQPGLVGATLVERWPTVGRGEVVHDHQAAGAEPRVGLDRLLTGLPLTAPVGARRSNGPAALSSRQSPCRILTCGVPSNTARAACARAASRSMLTSRTPERAPLASHANPS